MSQHSLFGIEQHTTTSDDYYTPAWIFEGMGIEFDLDPASPPGGVAYIPTRDYYTQADDGLNAPWYGRVWVNPPFSDTTAWARRFVAHGNGVMLAPVSKAAWPSEVWSAAAVVWLPRRAPAFGTPGQNRTEAFISYAVFLAAMGDECSAGLRRLAAIHEGALMQPVTS